MDLPSMWESDRGIRLRIRETRRLTMWPSAALTTIPSVRSMVLNIRPLLLLAQWWVNEYEVPKAIPINIVRRQVACLNSFVCDAYFWNSILHVCGAKPSSVPQIDCLSKVEAFRQLMSLPIDPPLTRGGSSGSSATGCDGG